MPANDRARMQRGTTRSDTVVPLSSARRSLTQRLAATISAHRRISDRIDVAAAYAAQTILEQPSLLRQTVARSWALRARVLRMSLDATRSMHRSAVEQTRAEVSVAADRLVAEIIASMEGWVRTDQSVTRLQHDLAAVDDAPAERVVMPSVVVLTEPPAPVVAPHASPRPLRGGVPSGGPRRYPHPSPRPHDRQDSDHLSG